MVNTVITNFPITVYGKMEKFSDTISRGRCRVFYKGRNRNGTYITDEFAQKLIASAPYTPVKGIYEIDDYTDHGTKRSEGRIYGIVPADPKFAWEKYLDQDGIEREYACFDVLYYTALYKEAGEIEGKSESMELYRETLQGEWKIIDGKKTYVFTDGCFLGLQALGDDVEPCFEGASFYSNEGGEPSISETESNIIALLEKYEKRTDLFQYHEQGGNETMPSINFKISDSQKFDFLFNLLNPNFNEEGGWMIEYCICDVYDEYAVVRNYAEGIFERVFYTKDDENDSLEITNKERCYIVDVNEAEKEALNQLRGEGTFEQAAQNVAEKDATINSLQEGILTHEGTISTLTAENENLKEENSQYSTKVAELESNISTLTIERDETRANYEDSQASYETLTTAHNELTTTYNELTATHEALTATHNELSANYEAVVVERDALAEYKKQIETDAKKAVVSNYTEQLAEEVIDAFMTNLDSYTIEELDMKLTYELKKANPTLFSKQPVAPANAYLPKDDNSNRGINDILARFEKH
jgi:hypothetical protein